MDGDTVALSAATAGGYATTVPEGDVASTGAGFAGQVTVGAWVSKLERGIAHSSRPRTRSEAMKKRLSPAAIRVPGLELRGPGTVSPTSDVPAAVPSVR